MSQIAKIKMYFLDRVKQSYTSENPKATITTVFFFLLEPFQFTHNMKHLQLCFGRYDFHLPEEGLIIPNRSHLPGLTSSNREWWGTDLRKTFATGYMWPNTPLIPNGSLTLIPQPHTLGRGWTCSENILHYQRLPLKSGKREGHSR